MVDAVLKTLCKDVLDEGLELFDLNLGIVSKIDDNSYYIVAVMPEKSVFQAGESFDLKDTYCREVVDTRSVVALTQLENTPGLCKHPLYSGLPLESYISAPIMINDDVWGTLNFSSMKIREGEFSSQEIEVIKSRARSIAECIKNSL